MGFFSDIVSETRRGAISGTAPATTPPMTRKAAPVPAPAAVPTQPAPAAPVTAPERPPQPAPSPAPEPAEKAAPRPVPEPQPAEPRPEAPEPPAIDLTAGADAAEEAERKRAHEAAEAKRRAEFDARQAGKQAARRKELDRIAAMSGEDAAANAIKRVGDDTERLTRRNMKEAVCEHVQARCREDVAFARRAILPEKSMANCFQYIYRMAREYAEREMKENGVERTGAYGCDVPDGLCFQWAEDYFNSDDIREDHKDAEQFIPKPYVPATRKKTPAKAAKKPPAAAKPKAPESCVEQISLM